MNVKRYFSKSMQDVLKQVREDLGPDAVILSNTRVDGGIEVVAALDYEEEVAEKELQASVMQKGQPSPSQLARMHAERHIQLQKEMERAKRRIETVRSQKKAPSNVHSANIAAILSTDHSAIDLTAADPGMPSANREDIPGSDAMMRSRSSSGPSQGWDELSDMRAEIMELKNMIKGNVSASAPIPQNVATNTPIQDQVEKGLKSLCIAEHIITELVKLVAREVDFGMAWEKVKAQLVSSMNPEYSEVIDRGGVIALVGPTGSGKTMTIGKMAARYVMKYGADSIALVTTDRYRIAAHEQLKVFGRILNVPVHVVDDDHPIDTILDKLSDKKLVLVDTAGLMHTDSCWSEQLQELKMSRHQIKPYLVVSAVGQYQVMCATYHYYKIAGLAGTIITKVDEAVSLGEVVSFLSDTKLRVAYYADGQRVPEDIHLLQSIEFIDKAEGLLNSSERWVTISTPEQQGVSDSIYFHSA